MKRWCAVQGSNPGKESGATPIATAGVRNITQAVKLGRPVLAGRDDTDASSSALFSRVETQAARAFAAACLLAPAHPQMGRTVQPARELIVAGNAGAFARDLFLVKGERRSKVRFKIRPASRQLGGNRRAWAPRRAQAGPRADSPPPTPALKVVGRKAGTRAGPNVAGPTRCWI